MQTAGEELLFQVCQGVEHLNGPLRPPKIEHFLGPSLPLDRLYVRNVIVPTHFSPAIRPKLGLLGTQLRMLLAVLSATVIAQPDIIPRFCKLELQRHTCLPVIL